MGRGWIALRLTLACKPRTPCVDPAVEACAATMTGTTARRYTMQQGNKAGSTGVMDRPRMSATTPDSPVDDRTYNVMQALVSKLEAIEAYEMYAADEGGELFRELLTEERQHAQKLLDELRSCLNVR
jgi:hypothetical protein